MTSAVISTLSDLVSFLSQSFKLAAVFPAFIFVCINEFCILPMLPESPFICEFDSLSITAKLLIAVLFALVIGYTLTIINVPLIRLFEGYPFFNTWYGKLMRQWHKERAKELERRVQEFSKLEMRLIKLRERIESLENKWEVCKKGCKIDDPVRIQLYTEIKSLKSEEENLEQIMKEKALEKAICEAELRNYFPPDRSWILPTKLGNMIFAFEEYPRTRYNIDSVTLWPRLLPILTKVNYAVYVEREKAALDFALNTCFLFLILSIEMFYVGLLFAQNYMDWFICAIMVALVAYIFYKISITGAFHWGVTVCVAFDMFRYNLLAALHGRPPRNFSDEKSLWLRLSRFLREGLKDAKEEEAMSYSLHYYRIQSELRKEIR